MTDHTPYARWYANQSDEYKARKSVKTYRVHQSGLSTYRGSLIKKKCMVCQRNMATNPVWRTVCKRCEPSRTVD
jgi:hypothetical protein